MGFDPVSLATIGAIGSTAGGVASLARQQPQPAPLQPPKPALNMPQAPGFQSQPLPTLQVPQQPDLMSLLQQISQRSL
jgi:hypothetical protein